MKVLKFGGTSVGTVASLENVKKIVADKAGESPLIVVVSALGGITDSLIAGANAAVTGRGHIEIFEQIAARHREVIAGVVDVARRPVVSLRVEQLLEELFNIYRGVSLIGDLSSRTLDIIVSYGERMSSVIVSSMLENARLFDSREFIKTVTQGGREVLDSTTTARLVEQTLGAGEWTVAVVPGFISSNAVDSRITNLGRGGSDYTAAIIAATLGADVLEIWTDVDGFMTADPRVINKTYVIDRLSFVEAMELCHFGAKVIYPPTIYPVYHADIPVYIKNTFNPSAPGTLITRTGSPRPGNKAVKGISSINDTCLVTVSGPGMVGVKGINARIFNALTRAGVSVFLVAQASSENNTSIGVRAQDAATAVEALCDEFAAEIASGEINPVTARDGLATIAIVGESMKDSPGVAGRMFNTLGRNGIGVVAFAQGASGINISAVIEQRDLRKSLNVLHDALFLSDSGVLNIFLAGTGNVGGPLLKQIAAQQDNLMKNKALKLNVVGIANSRKCHFDRDGIDLDRYRDLLDAGSIVSSPQVILDHILQMNIYNPVFVDCTANAAIAALYPTLLQHNVNVVAANKTAASGDLNNYLTLKQIARDRDVKFLFETNVGAGLPIINTINSLINSGDRILKIEAVLSGTLNYIFNTISSTIPMSRAVEMAIEAGYAEPDPRVDLSGRDVVRKIVILARESGYAVEAEDTLIEPIIPADVMQAPSVEEFMERLKTLDPMFEQTRREAADAGERFRFIATLEEGRLSVALNRVGPSHPFYSLEGSNNIILLTTERYREFPIEIKGYGAGAEVTAAGVFA
ncbi:MAG: bifunctional aspartate kinase/homoserine dehydrogenase I, partial [Muribaculaceae bacterium]|nr:bifunctional aspartate kinase/homoserine dehydrogenase I [Muribaculaceae bacterium]